MEAEDEASATRLTDDLLSRHPENTEAILIRAELYRKTR